MTDATIDRNPVASADVTPPEWDRRPTEPIEETAHASYRGLRLTANGYYWSITGARWHGYQVLASEHHYGPGRPSIEENMAAAVAAADDLLAKGWTPA